MILPLIGNPIQQNIACKEKKKTNLSFSSRIDTYSPDFFVHQNNIPEYFEKTYNNIKKTTGTYSENMVKTIAAKVLDKFPEISEGEILFIMEKLSEYSSISSINHIAKNLYKEKFMGVYDYSYELFSKDEVVKDIKENNSTNFFETHNTYINTKPHIVTHITMSQGLPLGCVLDYLTFMKYPMLYGSNRLALILDKNSIKLLKKIKEESPVFFKENFLENKKLIPVYIDDFENSFNFLNYSSTFEKKVTDFTEEYALLKKANPSCSKEKICDTILNSKNLGEIESLGFVPIRLKPPLHRKKSSFDEIVKNLNPPIPAKEDFKNMINTIAGTSKKLPVSKIEQLLLDYLNFNLALYSPASLSEKLKILHKKIEQTVKAKGLPAENIYYTVLHPSKSFGYITYQYQHVNNIPDEKIVYWKGSAHLGNTNFSLPEKSTLVILDDCFVSGNTVLHEMFDYRTEALSINKKKKDLNILFASVLATDSAISRIKSNIKRLQREGHDEVVCVDTRDIDWSKKIESKYVFDFYKLLRPDGKTFATTAIVFPYMGSDTNSPVLRRLFSSFVPNPNYLHNEVHTDDFFND